MFCKPKTLPALGGQCSFIDTVKIRQAINGVSFFPAISPRRRASHSLLRQAPPPPCLLGHVCVKCLIKVSSYSFRSCWLWFLLFLNYCSSFLCSNHFDRSENNNFSDHKSSDIQCNYKNCATAHRSWGHQDNPDPNFSLSVSCTYAVQDKADFPCSLSDLICSVILS